MKKIALIHDWLIHMRGGEKCLEGMVEIFPDADIFTLFSRREQLSKQLRTSHIRNSFLNYLPGILKHYRYTLPVMPLAIKQFNLKNYDLIISSSHCAAKGVRVPAGIPHICYCYTPMRYIWRMEDVYFSKDKYNFLARNTILRINKYLRIWDISTNSSVTHFIAISKTIQKRITKYYGRDSDVVYPPVDTDFFQSVSKKREDYFLIVSALVPYKRIDLAVNACNKLNIPLVIIGDGPEKSYLKKIAKNNVKFMGWVSNIEIRKYLSTARGLVFPGEEDFGIVPVEAQACGTPVIAFNKGGATETVLDNLTGVFFNKQIVEDLLGVLHKFNTDDFSPEECRKNALGFSKQQYLESLKTSLSPWMRNTRRENEE